MAKGTIKVKSTFPKEKDGGSRIALSEENPQHPDGHAFVASPDKWVEVYPTPLVLKKISEGDLKQFGEGDTDDEPVSPTDTGSSDEKPEIKEGDTPETLIERYDRKTLMTWQSDLGLNLPQNTSSLKVAEAILTHG